MRELAVHPPAGHGGVRCDAVSVVMTAEVGDQADGPRSAGLNLSRRAVGRSWQCTHTTRDFLKAVLAARMREQAVHPPAGRAGVCAVQSAR
jgi:hypothetical protein